MLTFILLYVSLLSDEENFQGYKDKSVKWPFSQDQRYTTCTTNYQQLFSYTVLAEKWISGHL